MLLPNALPELFSRVRVAPGASAGTLVAAEPVGAQEGLGAMIHRARPFVRLDVMRAGATVISVLGGDGPHDALPGVQADPVAQQELTRT